MSSPKRLRPKVILILNGHSSVNRRSRIDIYASRSQRADLRWVVGVDGNVRDVQMQQHGNRCLISTVIIGKAKLRISINRIQAKVLVSIRPHLGADTRASPFLIKVKKNTAACLFEKSKPVLKLITAIAFERAAEITGNAR